MCASSATTWWCTKENLAVAPRTTLKRWSRPGMRHGLRRLQDMRAGDVIECYRVETIQRSL
jgi:hypothetical protein